MTMAGFTSAAMQSEYGVMIASVPGLPRSVRVFIMRMLALNVCCMRIMKTYTERGRPGTEASVMMNTAVADHTNITIITVTWLTHRPDLHHVFEVMYVDVYKHTIQSSEDLLAHWDI